VATLAATLEHALPTLFSARAPRTRVTSSLRRMEGLAWFLDDAVPIPGTSRRIGADVFMGLVPGVGSLVAGLVQTYVVIEAMRLGVPGRVLAKMIGNVVLDTTVGTVPIVGSVFDFFFKATRRNVRLLSEALQAG
jgi:hypothetical protein